MNPLLHISAGLLAAGAAFGALGLAMAVSKAPVIFIAIQSPPEPDEGRFFQPTRVWTLAGLQITYYAGPHRPGRPFIPNDAAGER